MTKIVNSIWTLLKWGTLCVLVLGAVIAVLAHYGLEPKVNRIMQAELQERFPNLEVSFKSAEFQESKGILLKKVVFAKPTRLYSEGRTILEAEEMFFELPITLPTLVQGDRRIRSMTINKPKIYLSHESEALILELQMLMPVSPPDKPMEPFPITVSKCEIHLIGDEDGSNPVFTGLDAKILSPEARENTESPASAAIPSDAWTFEASTSGEFLRQLRLNGWVEPKTRRGWVGGGVRKFQWDQEFSTLFAGFIPEVPNEEYRKILDSFRAKADFNFEGVPDPRSPLGYRFTILGAISDGKLKLPQLKGPLTEVKADFRLTQDTIDIENLSGSCGAIRAGLNYRQEGIRNIRLAVISANVEEIRLDSAFLRNFYPFLKSKIQEFLNDFDLSATANVSSKLIFDGTQWRPYEIDLKVREFELTFEKFPYKMEHLAGTVSLDAQEELNFNFVSADETQKIEIRGKCENTLSALKGVVHILGKDIPINEKLMKAFAAKQMDVITTLRPQGTLDGFIQLDVAEGDEVKKFIEIKAKNCSICYDGFPYPLRKIYGKIYLDDDSWQFEEMIGHNETAKVTGHGHVRTTEDGHELLLLVQVKELPIDGEIKQAILDPNQRSVLDGLQAKGKVDLSSQIRYTSSARRLSLRFEADLDPYAEQNSLYPEHFPCRIENLKGRINFNDGDVYVRQFRGQSKDMKIATGIQCRFNSDGSMRLLLSPMHISQLPPSDRDLHMALPENVRSLLSKIKIEGAVNIDGSIDISKGPGEKGKVRFHWDFASTLHQNNANFGLNMKNLCGRIYQGGSFEEGKDYKMGGWVELDSVHIEGLHLTDLIGPYYFDGKQLMLGQLPPDSIAPKRVPFPILPIQQPIQPQAVSPIIPYKMPSASEAAQILDTHAQARTIRAQARSGNNPRPQEFPEMRNDIFNRNFEGSNPNRWIPDNRGLGVLAPSPDPQQNIGSFAPPQGEIWTQVRATPTEEKIAGRYYAKMDPKRPDVMTAKIFGGNIKCNGWVEADKALSYRIRYKLDNANLRELIQEFSPGNRQQIQGKLGAAGELWGVGGNRETLGGFGRVTLRDADIYELPQMMKLLQILSIAKPQRGAFSSGDIDFRLIGNDVVLDSVIFDGDLFNLYGKGDMRLDSLYVRIMLRARLGNRRSQIPIISDILGEAGDQITRIRVDGQLTGPGPKVTQETLPGVRKVFDRLQNDE